MYNCPICGKYIDCIVIFRLLSPISLVQTRIKYRLLCPRCFHQMHQETMKIDDFFFERWGNFHGLVFSITGGDERRYELWNWDVGHFDGRIFNKNAEVTSFFSQPFHEICKEIVGNAVRKIRDDRSILHEEGWMEITGFYRR